MSKAIPEQEYVVFFTLVVSHCYNGSLLFTICKLNIERQDLDLLNSALVLSIRSSILNVDESILSLLHWHLEEVVVDLIGGPVLFLLLVFLTILLAIVAVLIIRLIIVVILLFSLLDCQLLLSLFQDLGLPLSLILSEGELDQVEGVHDSLVVRVSEDGLLKWIIAQSFQDVLLLSVQDLSLQLLLLI